MMLGSRLFHDPCGPTALYGDNLEGLRKARTSWKPDPGDPDQPANLVCELELSAMGCCWLIERWQELRDHITSGGFWRSEDRLYAIRLLGRQPLDAAKDRRVADIFAASNALRRVGKPFDDLGSDMGEDELAAGYRQDVRARFKDLARPDEIEKARQILIELADEKIAEIEVLLDRHDAVSPEEQAERTKNRLGFVPGSEADAIRRHLLKCRADLDRGIASYQKYKKNAEGSSRAERRAERERRTERRTPSWDSDWAVQAGRRAEEKAVRAGGATPQGGPPLAGRGAERRRSKGGGMRRMDTGLHRWKTGERQQEGGLLRSRSMIWTCWRAAGFCRRGAPRG